jgi:hypothetical protein
MTARRRVAAIVGITMGLMVMLLVLVARTPNDRMSLAGREAVLRTNLQAIRQGLEAHRQDRGSYPASLDDLVEGGYLRTVPIDGITGRSDTWRLSRTPEGTIADVRSGSSRRSRKGAPYSEW